MILLLDVGGTRLKWATWDGAFQFGGAQAHDDQPLTLFDEQQWPRLTGVWISLVPRMRDIPAWTALVQKKCGVQPRFAASQAEWNGLRVAYPDPAGYGVDRWLGLVALWSARQVPALLVSAGSAITVDRVEANGQHAGSVTAMGFGSMQRAMLQATRTPAVDAAPHHYNNELARDPVAAIRQAAYFSALGVINGALNAPSAIAGEQRILTGGDAETLLPLLDAGWQHRPYLVLEGLLALAQKGV